MSSVNNNSAYLLRTNCWNTSGNRLQSNVNQPRKLAFPTDSSALYSKAIKSNVRSRTTCDVGRNNQRSTQEATLHFSNHKEPNSCDLSKCNNLEESKTKESDTVKILENKLQGLTSSSESSSNNDLQKRVNNILSSNQGVASMPGTFNHTLTSTENDTDALDLCALNLEEKRRLRRERQKVKKEMKKQEKAIQREEEMRKKRLAPKDQKVTIIDHSILNRFLVKETSSVNFKFSSSSYNVSEFPTLGEVTSATSRSSLNRYQKRNGSKKEKAIAENGASVEQVLSELLCESKTSTAQSNSRDVSVDSISLPASTTVASNKNLQEKQANREPKGADDSIKTTKVDDKTGGKRPKRRDPIQLDINEILKVQETKLEVSVKQHSSKPASKAETARYAGNILDSDNPERKRGKQREVPKIKKPSALKQIILKERAKRKENHLQKPLTPSSEIDAKDENIGENLSRNKEHSSDKEEVICEKTIVNNACMERKSIDDKENEPSFSDYCDLSDSKIENTDKGEHVHLQLNAVPIIVKDTEDHQNLNERKEPNEPENKIHVEKNEEMISIEERKKLMVLFNCQTVSAELKSEKKSHEPRIHSRKFRNYCDHFITPDILSAATSLLEDIVKFHDRQFAHSPLKASAKRRHVTGLKEVRRFLTLRRVRLLVIAPDLEPTSSSGGLDDLVTQLKESAIANEVPYVFALSRRHLGYILKKKVPVSCVGVLNYDGTEQNFRNLMSAVENARQEYKLKVEQLSPMASESRSEINEQMEETPTNGDINKEVVASLLAKLAAPRLNVDSPDSSSPFLQAIEQRANMDSDSEEDQNEE